MLFFIGISIISDEFLIHRELNPFDSLPTKIAQGFLNEAFEIGIDFSLIVPEIKLILFFFK